MAIIEPEKPNHEEAYEHIKTGVKHCCGHDFWDKPHDYGDVVMCGRCHQYFVKTRSLVWLTKTCFDYMKKKYPDYKDRYGTNHLETTTWYPVTPRLSERHIK